MIYEFLADGFEEVEALAPVDILRRGGCEVKTVSIMESKTVSGAHGASVVADIMFGDTDFSDADMIVFPGGMPGAANLADHEGLTQLIDRQFKAGKRIAAICASPAVVLAKTGILKGKKATCYPGLEDKLVSAEVSEAVTDAVVTDGTVTTSRGPATAMAFGIELVRLMAGDKTAAEMSEGLLYK